MDHSRMQGMDHPARGQARRRAHPERRRRTQAWKSSMLVAELVQDSVVQAGIRRIPNSVGAGRMRGVRRVLLNPAQQPGSAPTSPTLTRGHGRP